MKSAIAGAVLLGTGCIQVSMADGVLMGSDLSENSFATPATLVPNP